MDSNKQMPQAEDEWKEKLSPEAYKVLREKGTEAPFSGKLLHEKRDGMYRCAACGTPLFPSDARFDSGTGWPSFDKALLGAVKETQDTSHSMERVEITCAQCGSHLGHVFGDVRSHSMASQEVVDGFDQREKTSYNLNSSCKEPTETGKRYCMNSVCLGFEGENG